LSDYEWAKFALASVEGDHSSFADSIRRVYGSAKQNLRESDPEEFSSMTRHLKEEAEVSG
jgi:hypothetical protein